MKTCERDALLNYLDSQLMVLCQAVKPHIDPDAVGTLYESAYGILSDLLDSIMVEDPLLVAKKRIGR